MGINTRRQLDCVYLKQRLNCMLFCADDTWTSTSSMLDDDACDQPNHIEVVGSEDIANEEDKVEEYFDSSDDENQSHPYSKYSNDTKYMVPSDGSDNCCDRASDKNLDESESSI